MNNDEMLVKLNSMFNKRYGQRIADMNRNVYISQKENGMYDVPVPILGEGGGTVVMEHEDAVKLNSPAVATVKNKKMYAMTCVYRIALSRNECEVAVNKPEYFNFFFDTIINKAINNYNHTFGGEDKVRFGTVYCSAERPGSKNLCITDLDGGDFLELRLYGNWASDKEVPIVKMEG